MSYIKSLVKSCKFHIMYSYAVKKCLKKDNLITLVHLVIVSLIDYGNSVLFGLPGYLIEC